MAPYFSRHISDKRGKWCEYGERNHPKPTFGLDQERKKTDFCSPTELKTLIAKTIEATRQLIAAVPYLGGVYPGMMTVKR